MAEESKVNGSRTKSERGGSGLEEGRRNKDEKNVGKNSMQDLKVIGRKDTKNC